MTRVYAGDGRPLAEFASERRVFVPIEAIPKGVVDAFLSAEDRNFYSHHGIDPASILRAAITDVGRLRENSRPVGASTITQQVAKICSRRTRFAFSSAMADDSLRNSDHKTVIFRSYDLSHSKFGSKNKEPVNEC